jgi:hypothetical protein
MARKFGRVYSVAVGAASIQILPYSTKRRGLAFVGPNTGRITIVTEGPATLDAGITLSGTAGVVEFPESHYGDLATHAFFAIADAAGRNLGVAEVLEE